jgi:hypothetical protein
MHLLYPKDWAHVGICPEVIVFEPRIYRRLNVAAVLVGGENLAFKEISTCVETRSEGGLVRSFKFFNLTSPGDYAVQFSETEFQHVVATVGLRISTDIFNVDLVPALNSIEYFYTHTREVRFISNGVGKSGTSWLYHILGTFPGITCLDMSAMNFSGGCADELASVPYSSVYHGHLGYLLGNAEALQVLDYHHAYIYRDLRAVVVSEYFHKFHLAKGEHRIDLAERPVEEMLTLDMIYRWSNGIYGASNVLGWLRSGMCAMISYENLSASPEQELSLLMDKFGLPCHENLIQYVVKMNTFEVHSGGRKSGETDPSSFFRNGTPEGWRYYLSAEVAKGIADRNPDYFKVLGYL